MAMVMAAAAKVMGAAATGTAAAATVMASAATVMAAAATFEKELSQLEAKVKRAPPPAKGMSSCPLRPSELPREDQDEKVWWSVQW